MTSLSPSRRAADEFAAVVDGLQADDDGRYGDLLTFVDVLRGQEPPLARAEFVTDLRASLMAAADELLVPAGVAPVTTLPRPAPSRSHRRERRLGTIAAAFVVIGSTAGVAAAAQQSLPGDPLYPLKRAVENVQYTLSTTDEDRSRDLLQQANARLDELHGLISQDKAETPRVARTLSSFESSTSDAADLVFVDYQREGDPAELASLRQTLGAQLARLDSLAGDAPATSRPRFDAARALLHDLDQQALVLCGGCGDADSLSSSLLTSAPAKALASLLAQPAIAAQHEQQTAAANSKLAHAADQVAQQQQASDGQSQPSSATGGLKLPDLGTSVPSGSPTPTQSGGTAVHQTVEGVTGGVDQLLGQVSGLTGGATTPLTDTLTSTLDGVTNLLP